MDRRPTDRPVHRGFALTKMMALRAAPAADGGGGSADRRPRRRSTTILALVGAGRHHSGTTRVRPKVLRLGGGKSPGPSLDKARWNGWRWGTAEHARPRHLPASTTRLLRTTASRLSQVGPKGRTAGFSRRRPQLPNGRDGCEVGVAEFFAIDSRRVDASLSGVDETGGTDRSRQAGAEPWQNRLAAVRADYCAEKRPPPTGVGGRVGPKSGTTGMPRGRGGFGLGE